MERQSRKRLEEALKEFGSSDRSAFTGAGDAGELSPHLEIASSLRADAQALSGTPNRDHGREQLLSSLINLEETSGGIRRMIFSQPLFIKVAGAAAGVAMLFVGMAGASAAAGGPDIADPVFNAAGIGDSDDDAFEEADDVDDDADDLDDADDDDDADDLDDADDDADEADDDTDDDADDADDDVEDHVAGGDADDDVDDSSDDVDQADDDADDSDDDTDGVDDSPDDSDSDDDEEGNETSDEGGDDS